MHENPPADRQAYYARIDQAHMTPLWEVLHALVPREPKSAALPHLWRYADIRPAILESGSLIGAKEAV
ncbi:MAG: hypothetical protein ACKOEE_16200, partial [Tagaea sp.]